MKPWELGHKKMSRNKNKTVGGHTGCSEGNISQSVAWSDFAFLCRIQLQELSGQPARSTEPGERTGPFAVGKNILQLEAVLDWCIIIS